MDRKYLELLLEDLDILFFKLENQVYINKKDIQKILYKIAEIKELLS